ncbi:MAG: helix-turn-helix domain-containing protein [Desulfobulbaceae bacterium]|nr:helix-turn-helix domain-containing protein [Desulfobulbaceae bacterium]
MGKSGKKNDSKQDEVQLEKPEFEHTGQYLRKLRTDKELTIKDVSNTTRISEVNLNAIEAQDFSTLPADTFTRGLLAIYAEFLGIDPTKVVPQFMQERDAGKFGGKRTRPKQRGKILTPKTLAEPSNVSSLTTAVILLIVIIVLFVGFCLYTSWNPFSFLTDKENSIQSITMGFLPATDSDMEQPKSDNLKNLHPPSGRNIENITPVPDSAPNSLTRHEITTADANDKTAVLPENMNGTAAFTFPEDLQSYRR